mmetsp:Transcript_45441/g.120415  ORF Transcript_45441/g.120415 Transcript_45441/m.120415 type:complete len:204 (-) Transcript_45441:279-890(-)
MNSSKSSVFCFPFPPSMMFSRFCSSSSVFLCSFSFSRTGSISLSRCSYSISPSESLAKAVCICCRCSARALRSRRRSSACLSFRARSLCCSSRAWRSPACLFRKPPIRSRSSLARAAIAERTSPSCRSASGEGCRRSDAARSSRASSRRPSACLATPRRYCALAVAAGPKPFLATSQIASAFPAASSAARPSSSRRCTCAKLE